MDSEGKIQYSSEATDSGEGGESWSLPQREKPEQGRYCAGIDRTGIYQSQNLILEVWKAEQSDSISCIHLESHNMENISISFLNFCEKNY